MVCLYIKEHNPLVMEEQCEKTQIKLALYDAGVLPSVI